MWYLQAKRAAGLLAAAQHAAADELRPAKRQRQRSLREYVGPPGGHLLLGVRISVYWPDDDAFYKVPDQACPPTQSPCRSQVSGCILFQVPPCIGLLSHRSAHSCEAADREPAL